jgi:hypothetical protein
MLSSLVVVVVHRVVVVQAACYKVQIIQSLLAQHLQSRWAQEVQAVTEVQDKRVQQELTEATLYLQHSLQSVAVAEIVVGKP